MKTRLEYHDSKSQKFWQISVKGDAHTVNFGKVGTEGQAKNKSFSDAAAALQDAQKLIQQKLKKGYTVVEADQAGMVSSAKKPTAKKNIASKSTAGKQAEKEKASPPTAKVAGVESYSPLDFGEIQKNASDGRPLSIDHFHELAALFFEYDRYDRREGQEGIMKLMKSQGPPELKELISSNYDFDIAAKLFRYVCEQPLPHIRARIFKSFGDDIHVGETRVRSLPDDLAQFQELKHISLAEAFFKVFPPVLLQLKNLVSLNFYASKIEELPAEIGELSELESLEFERNRLKTLPVEIARLKKLRTLDLRKNVLEDLPEELCELTQLERVDFEGNSGIPAADLNKLFKEFHNSSTLVPDRKVLLNLVLDKKERASELADLPQLIMALNSGSAVVRTNALQVLDTRLEIDLKNILPAGSLLGFAGKFHFALKAMKERLVQNGFRVSAKINTELDRVVLGEKPGDFDIASFQGAVLTEATFQKLIDQIDTPYLQDQESTPVAATENLGRLLESPDPKNQALAIEIMKTGGVPPDQIGGLFAVAFLSEDAAIRKTGMTLLKQHASTELQRKLAGRVSFLNVATEKKMSEYIENFAALSEIDGQKLARSVFAANKMGKKYLLENGDESTQREVLSTLIEGDTLSLTYADLPVLPAVIGEFKQLRVLSLHGNELTEIPDGLFDLQELEELDISHNKLKTAPTGFTQLKNLRDLNICGNKMREFPVEIPDLPNLKRLELWGNNFKKFPDNMRRLKVEKLYFQGKFSAVPAQICEIESLRELVFYEAGLTDLPDELSQLICLEKLDLQHNEFTTIPQVVFELPALEVLVLTFNKLREIPPEIAKLKKLKELHIRANRTLKGALSLKELQKLLPGCHIEENSLS